MARHYARLFFAEFAFLLLSLISSHAVALDVPPLRGRINDYAALLPAAKSSELEARLAQFEQETGHQVALLTIPTLDGDSLEDFSIRVAESWKIGRKGFDNGAILIIAAKDRKLRIEVGYGLEGVLPDAIASRIIREVIVPEFRANNYSGGIEAGLDAIMRISRGETLPERARNARPERSEGSPLFTILMVSGVLALFVGMTRRRPLSGALGGGAAGALTTLFSGGSLGAGLVPAILLGIFLGGLGSTMSMASGSQWTSPSRRRRGGWGGGFYPGGFGGGFGGGGGGGGFSGGGGGFGGGGASGSW